MHRQHPNLFRKLHNRMGLGGTLNPNGTSPPKRERERVKVTEVSVCGVSGHMVRNRII